MKYRTGRVDDVWRDGEGRPAGTVYEDSLGHRRVVTPPMTVADDGTTTYGHEAVAVFAAHCDEVQARRRVALRRTTPRPRGAGRPKTRTSSARRSSERSGDSGEDGPSDEAEPPSPRPCECECGLSAAAGSRYFNDTHAARVRKRRERERDKANPDRIWERKAKRLEKAEALREKLLERGEQLTAENLPKGCRCPGEGFDKDPEGDMICVPCGRPLKVPGTSPNGYDARMAQARDLMRNDSAEGRQVHRHHRPREWRTRPRRDRSTKLRAENLQKRKTGEYRWDEPTAREEVA
jgi:hypothetical protein